jgi:hypothetical protein
MDRPDWRPPLNVIFHIDSRDQEMGIGIWQVFGFQNLNAEISARMGIVISDTCTFACERDIHLHHLSI